MTNQNIPSSQDDTLLFAKEKHTRKHPYDAQRFKLLIVDDEKEVHAMTRLVLKDYQYQGKGLEFLSAFSGNEARQILLKQPDIACCLLDVVMETKEAGLEVARFIREEIANDRIRIILRTGQPGKAPEKEIILCYDINDYKEKTELTSQKLFTTITTALRSYLHLVELDEKNNEIQAKNIRLNEEIARRIVAESNLTKYNRSLERMIENKTQRLEKALKKLEETKAQLFTTQKTAILPELSSASLDSIEDSSERMASNMKKMDDFRHQMTSLLEKYTTLETIIVSHVGQDAPPSTAQKRVTEIQVYKDEIGLEKILENYPEIIEDSRRGICKIAKTIGDIKMFVSISDETRVPVDVNHTIRTLLDSLDVTNSKIDFQVDLQNIPVLSLPEESFTRAIGEIIDNALHAVSGQGIVSIATRFHNNQVEISFSDIGIGISEDTLPRIFIPYFKGWQNGKKGLGLSFAKSVLFNCGGDILVQSTLNEGTTVTLTLPGGNAFKA